MSAELKEEIAGRNPRTVEEARAFVKHVESLFMPWNVEGIVAGFTDDCVVRFSDMPEFRGKAELTRFLRARSARQKGYRLRKELRAMMGDVLANYWEGDWEDAQTGAKMTGRGVEIWQLRGGKIALLGRGLQRSRGWQDPRRRDPLGEVTLRRGLRRL
ncbi:MAG TPA: nuclear transport factor 2 family protein [Stellaceae bacterium]|nr:nuclear transport factor 2 family protein [Stellaceae bacterium]